MKNHLLLIISLACSCPMLAQPQAGSFSITPKVGMTLSESTGGSALMCHISQRQFEPGIITGSDLDDISSLTTQTLAHKRKSGFTIGLDLQFQLTNNFALVSGIDFAQLRSSVDLDASSVTNFDMHEVTNTMNNLQLPVLAKLYLYKGLSIQTGLEFDWNLSSKVKMSYDFKGNRLSAGNDLSKVETNGKTYYVGVYEAHMDNIEDFYVAIPMGISYEYQNLELSASYSIAATRSSKAEFSYEKTINLRNSTFMFTLGYRLDLLGGK